MPFSRIILIMLKEFIKELRLESGLNQVEFGRILNFSQDTISKWEKGTRSPDYKTLIKIALVFDVDMNEMLGLEEYRHKYHAEIAKKQADLREITNKKDKT